MLNDVITLCSGKLSGKFDCKMREKMNIELVNKIDFKQFNDREREKKKF